MLAKTPYSYKTRFENERGTNPEELIAAAHAGCFTMALAFGLQKAGYTPTELSTEAVTLIPQGQGFRISRSALSLRASVPNIDETTFTRLASDAEKTCPVSRGCTSNKTRTQLPDPRMLRELLKKFDPRLSPETVATTFLVGGRRASATTELANRHAQRMSTRDDRSDRRKGGNQSKLGANRGVRAIRAPALGGWRSGRGLSVIELRCGCVHCSADYHSYNCGRRSIVNGVYGGS